MSDINLLPDELRKEESRLNAGHNQQLAGGFHVPGANLPAQPKPVEIRPPEPKDQADMFDQAEPKKEDLPEPKKEVKTSPAVVKNDLVAKPKPPQPARAAQPGFFKKLFGKKPKGNQVFEGLEPDADKPFGVNLIPAGSYLISTKRICLLLAVSFLSACLVLALALLAIALLKQNIRRAEEEIAAKLAESEKTYELLKAKEGEAIRWSKNVESVKNLLAKHVYWTKFFDELEKLTLPEVYYSSIEASLGGEISLTAAADTYTTVARQYLVFQRATESVKNFSISGLEGDALSGKISFGVTLQLADDIYYSK